MNKPRIYGAWARNPAGHKEDSSRCIESVIGNERGAMAHQCDRKRGHGKDGLYCKQHDPEAVKSRRAAVTNKYNDKWAVKQRGWDLDAKRKEVSDLAKALVKVRSFGPEFDTLAKAVDELNDLEKS